MLTTFGTSVYGGPPGSATIIGRIENLLPIGVHGGRTVIETTVDSTKPYFLTLRFLDDNLQPVDPPIVVLESPGMGWLMTLSTVYIDGVKALGVRMETTNIGDSTIVKGVSSDNRYVFELRYLGVGA